jgi:hypothetical protein
MMKNKDKMKLEKDWLKFCREMFDGMEWGEFPTMIFRVQDKVEFMQENGKPFVCRGLCEPCFITGYFRISISLEECNKGDHREMVYTVIHEMIHVYMVMRGYPWRIAGGHGKEFKRIAKQIELKTNGTFKAKRIIG